MERIFSICIQNIKNPLISDKFFVFRPLMWVLVDVLMFISPSSMNLRFLYIYWREMSWILLKKLTQMKNKKNWRREKVEGKEEDKGKCIINTNINDQEKNKLCKQRTGGSVLGLLSGNWLSYHLASLPCTTMHFPLLSICMQTHSNVPHCLGNSCLEHMMSSLFCSKQSQNMPGNSTTKRNDAA